jgi:putative thioredoxin
MAQLLPAPGVDEVMEGRAHLRAGRWQPAADLLRVAIALDPSKDAVRADYVRALAELGRLDEAWRAWLPLRGRGARDPAIAATGLWIEALSAAQDAGDETALRSAAAGGQAQPRYALAQWLIARQRWAEALDVLIALVGSDRAFGDDLARRTMLAVFELAGDPALVADYRRRLSAALF